LARMLHYVENNEDRGLLVLTGAPGCGKSSLLAECARRCRARFRDAVVVPYFVGAAPDSTDFTTTVSVLCSALKRECGLDVELPSDPARLSVALPEFLERASAVRPVILILDAINQLDPARGSHELHWLPFRLPCGVKIIVSSLPGDCLDHLRTKVRPRNVLHMRGMPRAERAKLVNEQLDLRGKRLGRRHLSRLLDTERRADADLPLYLMVALEELSLVGGMQALESGIESLPATLEGLFDHVLRRLEWDHSRDLCESVLRWLAVSRSGLSELEILELLGTAIPPIRWARLYRALQFYLRPSNEATGSGLIGFYHEQLRSAVFRRYLRVRTPDPMTTPDQCRTHEELATYFRRIASDGRDPPKWRTHRPRGLSELPYHLHRAGHDQDVRGLLLDFEWLRMRLDTSDVVAVIDDYDYLRDDPSLSQIQGTIRQASHVLHGDTSQLASQLLGRLAGERDTGVRAVLAAARRWRGEPWFRPVRRSLTTASADLVRTLSGHSDAVFDFALTPNGRFLVSSSRDKSLKLWEFSTGKVLRTLTGHVKTVFAVAVTADGRNAISASMDRTLKVWDLASGRLLHTLKGHKDEVVCLALLSKGRQIVSGSPSRFLARPAGTTFKVWGVKSGRLMDTFFRTGDGILSRSILSARDERFILLERWDGTHDLMELMTGSIVCTTVDKRKHVTCAAMSPDQGEIALGCEDGRIDLVSLQTGRLLRQFDGHVGNVSTLYATPDGSELISGGGDRTVRMWNLASGRQERVLRGHSGTVSSAIRTPDGHHIVSSSYDKCLKIWAPGSEAGTDRRKAHSRDVRGVVATPCGTKLISCSDDGTIGVWSATTGRLIRTVRAHDDAIFSIAITKNGRFVLTGGNDCTIKIWDASSWTEYGVLKGARGAIAALAVTPDGYLILSGSWDNAVTLWDMRSGTKLRSLRKHESQVNSVALAPDGSSVLSGSADRKILVRKMNGETIATLSGHKGYVNAVTVMPDARHVVSASEDWTVKVWDLDASEAIRTLRGHTGPVNCIAVTPSGRYVVSGSDDMTVKAFEIESLRCVATFTAEGEVRACAVIGELELVVVGTADGQMHFLRFEPGQHPKSVSGETRRKSSSTGARHSPGIH
jgi:WD40 repeat protein